MDRIEAYEIVNHGVDLSQYFPGCGTAFTDYTSVATGIGYNAKEAYADAVEQLAARGWDTANLPTKPRGIRATDKVPADVYTDGDSEVWYFVSVRVR